MGHRFADIAFTESVREVQQALGSRAGYAAMAEGEDYNHVLGVREMDFIAARDSFYMASVSETGWPYVQHRGGPTGFVRVLDEQTLGFADFSGNRQYVSVGNLRKDNRVALFFMDYPNRTRLKLLGRVRLLGLEDEQLARVEMDDYRARVERGFLIQVEAFDWNCPQHITPRYTESEVEALLSPLRAENQALRQRQSETPALNDQAAAKTRQAEVLGAGPLELLVSGVRQLTPRIRAFDLRAPDGVDLPAFEPGSHLQLPVQLPDGEVVMRQYSICSDPARRDAYTIAVLREDDGRGGSRAVHATFELGMRMRSERPQNQFPLHIDERPAVLIAGGIGITPIKAMAQALHARGNTLQLHYAGRAAAEMAFLAPLQRQFAAELTVYRSVAGERMDIGQILSAAPADTVFYVCGPARLLAAVEDAAAALQIEPDRIRSERFTAAIAADARPIELTLQRSGKQLQVPADESILDTVLAAGVAVPFSCRSGNCKSCAVPVLAGEPEHHDAVLTEVERETQRLMCLCVSRAQGDSLVLDI